MASLSIAHPNGLVAALDKITNIRLGEKGHTEYQWSEPRPDPPSVSKLRLQP